MNLFTNIQNTPILILLYIISASIVIISSIYLSKYVDALDKKTNLSGAFIGGVILAAVTSLPELFTSLTAVCMLNQPELVSGNVYGSNIFNLVIISICVLAAPQVFKNSKISKTHKGTLIFTIIMFILSLCGIYIPEKYNLNIVITNINVVSLLIIMLYVINLKSVKGDDLSSDENDNITPLTIKQIITRFIFFAIVLVAVSILLTQITDILSSRLELGKTAAGAIFLGVATSLPELTASLNLVRLKNFNASVGNVTGSNLFNFTILCFGDFLYNSGSIYRVGNNGAGDFQSITENNMASIIIILFSILSSIIAILLLKLKKNTAISIILAFAMIVVYCLGIMFSM